MSIELAVNVSKYGIVQLRKWEHQSTNISLDSIVIGWMLKPSWFYESWIYLITSSMLKLSRIDFRLDLNFGNYNLGKRITFGERETKFSPMLTKPSSFKWVNSIIERTNLK